MGLNPKIWGSHAWRFIHYVALTYPVTPTEEDKKNYSSFFENLQHTLPCPICANNFKDEMKKFPINLSSQRGLFNWTVDIHNEVNKRTGKPTLTYIKALEQLSNDYAKTQYRKITNDYFMQLAPYLALSIITAYVLATKFKK